MFLCSYKFYLFLFVFVACGTLISGFRKRKKSVDSLTDSDKAIVSTVETILKDLEEDFKNAASETAKIESEIEEQYNTEAGEIKGKEAEEEKGEKELEEQKEENEVQEEKEEEKEMKEEMKEEEKESESNADETPKEDLITTPEEESVENIGLSSTAIPMIITDSSTEKEKGPEDTFVVWNTKGKVCLLAKFKAEFIVTYASKGGEQKADPNIPKHVMAKGNCESNSKSPILQISWEKYVFAMIFNKTEEENWIVSSMELTYDTSSPLFDRATNPGKKTARSKTLSMFETPLGKSFYCPGEEVVLMHSGNKQVVTARIKEIHLQPYGIEGGEFSPAHRCNKVVIDETLYVQDETVPLAVGCTLALITLFVLLGFSFHRAYNAAKVDYNTME